MFVFVNDKMLCIDFYTFICRELLVCAFKKFLLKYYIR